MMRYGRVCRQECSHVWEPRATRQVAGRGASHVSLMAVVGKTEVMGMRQLQRLWSQGDRQSKPPREIGGGVNHVWLVTTRWWEVGSTCAIDDSGNLAIKGRGWRPQADPGFHILFQLWRDSPSRVLGGKGSKRATECIVWTIIFTFVEFDLWDFLSEKWSRGGRMAVRHGCLLPCPRHCHCHCHMSPKSTFHIEKGWVPYILSHWPLCWWEAPAEKEQWNADV